MTYALAELASRVGGEVAGDGSQRIGRIAPLEDAGPGDLSFFAHPRYRAAFEASAAAAVVVEPGERVPPGRTVLRAPNAYLAFARLAALFHPPPAAVPGVAPQAYVHPSARIDPTAEVRPLAYVGAGAVVGPRCLLHPGAHVGDGARLGEACLLWPHAVVSEGCVLGDRVVLGPGCVVGADGFGFAREPAAPGAPPCHVKVPQAGNVVLEDDVELGANTCVDRATLGSTRVGRGTKVDNLVQIAHNVQIGPGSLLVAQVGVAGSTRLGAGVIAAGQVGIAGHLAVGDGARLHAQSGIMEDVPAGAAVMGSPARPRAAHLRVHAAQGRLPGLLRRVRELERTVRGRGGA